MLPKTPSVWKVFGCCCFFCAGAFEKTSAQNAQSRTVRNKILIGFSFSVGCCGVGVGLFQRSFVKAPSADSAASLVGVKTQNGGDSKARSVASQRILFRLLQEARNARAAVFG